MTEAIVEIEIVCLAACLCTGVTELWPWIAFDPNSCDYT